MCNVLFFAFKLSNAKINLGFAITLVYFAILISSYASGSSSGFLSQAVMTGRCIISIIISKIFGNSLYLFLSGQKISFGIEGFINNLDFGNITSSLSANLPKSLESGSAAVDVRVSDYFSSIVSSGINNNVISDVGSKISSFTDDTIGSISNLLNDSALKICSYVIVFLISMILLRFVAGFLTTLNFIPLLGGFNRILGGLFAIANVVIITQLVFLVLDKFSYVPIISTALKYIKMSSLLQYIYSNNFFEKIFL